MQDLSKSLVVVKRSGQRVSFNELKIAIAIKYAFDAFPNKYDKSYANKVYEDVMSFIMENYKDRKTINVEDIQDIIEEQLKKAKFFDVYEEFNSYDYLEYETFEDHFNGVAAFGYYGYDG